MDDENSLGKLVAESIKRESEKIDIYKKYQNDSHFLFWIWSHYLSQDEVKQYLINSFSADKNNVVVFLKAYVPTAWSMETGIPHKSDFERNHFDHIAQIIDPKIIFDKLENIFGESLSGAKDNFLRDEEDIDKKVASQFTYLYHFVQKEKAQNSQPDTAADR